MGSLMDEVDKLTARRLALEADWRRIELKHQAIDWTAFKAEAEDISQRLQKLEMKILEDESLNRVLRQEALKERSE